MLYHYPVNHDRLIIGRFCSIACGAKFLFNSANHALHSLSTYPFPIFCEEWGLQGASVSSAWDNKGDIVLGNDVWVGFEAVILAGVTIGDSAIIGARADCPQPHCHSVGRCGRAGADRKRGERAMNCSSGDAKALFYRLLPPDEQYTMNLFSLVLSDKRSLAWTAGITWPRSRPAALRCGLPIRCLIRRQTRRHSCSLNALRPASGSSPIPRAYRPCSSA